MRRHSSKGSCRARRDQLVVVGHHLVGHPRVVQRTTDHLGVLDAQVAFAERGIQGVESGQGVRGAHSTRTGSTRAVGGPGQPVGGGHAEIDVAAPPSLEHGQGVALDRLERGPSPLDSITRSRSSPSDARDRSSCAALRHMIDQIAQLPVSWAASSRPAGSNI